MWTLAVRMPDEPTPVRSRPGHPGSGLLTNQLLDPATALTAKGRSSVLDAAAGLPRSLAELAAPRSRWPIPQDHRSPGARRPRTSRPGRCDTVHLVGAHGAPCAGVACGAGPRGPKGTRPRRRGTDGHCRRPSTQPGPVIISPRPWAAGSPRCRLRASAPSRPTSPPGPPGSGVRSTGRPSQNRP